MLIDYGFPYSEEYIESLESENIDLLLNEYLSGTETEEKKENIFKRIWNWIVKQWNRFWNWITGKSSNDPAKKTTVVVIKEIEKTENQLEAIKSGIKEKEEKFKELDKTKQEPSSKMNTRREETDKIMADELNEVKKNSAETDRVHKDNQKSLDEMDKKIENLPVINGNESIKIQLAGYNIGLIHSVLSGISKLITTLADIMDDKNPLESIKQFKTEKEWVDVMKVLSLQKLPEEYISYGKYNTKDRALFYLNQEKKILKKNLTLYQGGITSLRPDDMMKILKQETIKDPNIAKTITDTLNEILKVYGHFCHLIQKALNDYNLYKIEEISGKESIELLNYLLSF